MEKASILLTKAHARYDEGVESRPEPSGWAPSRIDSRPSVMRW